VLGGEDLIILSEGVCQPKVLFVHLHSRLGDSEHLLTSSRICIFHQRFSKIDPHGREPFIIPFKEHIRPSSNSIQISGDPRRFVEDTQFRIGQFSFFLTKYFSRIFYSINDSLLDIFIGVLHQTIIREYYPVRGVLSSKSPLGLKIWLIETRE